MSKEQLKRSQLRSQLKFLYKDSNFHAGEIINTELNMASFLGKDEQVVLKELRLKTANRIYESSNPISKVIIKFILGEYGISYEKSLPDIYFDFLVDDIKHLFHLNKDDVLIPAKGFGFEDNTVFSNYLGKARNYDEDDIREMKKGTIINIQKPFIYYNIVMRIDEKLIEIATPENITNTPVDSEFTNIAEEEYDRKIVDKKENTSFSDELLQKNFKKTLTFNDLFKPEYISRIDIFYERLRNNGYIDKNNNWIIKSSANEPAKLFFYLKERNVIIAPKFNPSIKCFYSEFGCELVERSNGNPRATTRKNATNAEFSYNQSEFDKFLLTWIVGK